MWKNKPGYFITLEGIEGCGKTVQILHLANYLRGLSFDVLTSREPGGTKIGEQVRSILLGLGNTDMSTRTETLLFQAARAQIVDEVLKPNLEKGVIALFDRFADTTRTYQGYGRGQDLEVIETLIKYATDGITPDLSVFLDVDVEVGMKRRQRDSGQWNRLDALQIDFYEKARQGYLELVKAEPDRWLVVDANNGIEEVRADLLQKVEGRLMFDGYIEGNRRGPER